MTSRRIALIFGVMCLAACTARAQQNAAADANPLAGAKATLTDGRPTVTLVAGELKGKKGQAPTPAYGAVQLDTFQDHDALKFPTTSYCRDPLTFGQVGYCASGNIYIANENIAYEHDDGTVEFSTPRSRVTIKAEGGREGDTFSIYVGSTRYRFGSEKFDSPYMKYFRAALADYQAATGQLQALVASDPALRTQVAAQQAATPGEKIARLRQQIAEAQSEADSDDQQAGQFQAQGDLANSAGGLNSVGASVDYAAANRMRNSAQAERQKIDQMNAQIAQLQAQIAAAPTPAPAPTPQPVPAAAPAATLPVATVSAAFAMQSPALRATPAPAKPPASGPSLPDTMKFIQDKLTDPGTVNFAANVTDATSNTTGTLRIAEMRSNVVADEGTCRLSYRSGANRDVTVGMWQVEKVEVVPMEQFFNLEAAQAGHPDWSTQVQPAVSVMRAQLQGGTFVAFAFYDAALANRVAMAMIHAAELCGAGSTKEPF